MKRSVKHPSDSDVIDIVTISKREWLSLIFHSTGTNTALNLGWLNGGVVGNRFNGVKDLDVTGASTQVRPEMGRHRFAGEVSTLLRNLMMGAHDDAGNTKAALQSAACGKRVSKLLTFCFGQTFESGDLFVLAGLN